MGKLTDKYDDLLACVRHALRHTDIKSLSKECGVSPTTFYSLNLGKGNSTLATLRRAIDALELENNQKQ